MLNTTPTKKGKMASNPKKKGPISPSQDKKRVTLTQAANKGETSAAAPGEGTSANPGAILGPRASILGSPSMAKKLLGGVISPSDKEKEDKLSLDQVVTKFFHIVSQVSIFFRAQFAFLYFYYFLGDHKNLMNFDEFASFKQLYSSPPTMITTGK